MYRCKLKCTAGTSLVPRPEQVPIAAVGLTGLDCTLPCSVRKKTIFQKIWKSTGTDLLYTNGGHECVVDFTPRIPSWGQIDSKGSSQLELSPSGVPLAHAHMRFRSQRGTLMSIWLHTLATESDPCWGWLDLGPRLAYALISSRFGPIHYYRSGMSG